MLVANRASGSSTMFAVEHQKLEAVTETRIGKELSALIAVEFERNNPHHKPVELFVALNFKVGQ